MSEIEQANENVFEAPKASLSEAVSVRPVLEMTRFSAWGVFGLSIITFGLYAIYWLYSRMSEANGLSKVSKASTIAFAVYILSYIANIAIEVAIEAESATYDMASGVIGLTVFVSYIITVFSLRSAISDVINQGYEEEYRMSGFISALGTFFFSTIYLQYKINEAIDIQSE